MRAPRLVNGLFIKQEQEGMKPIANRRSELLSMLAVRTVN
jgi:hypothetical protein